MPTNYVDESKLQEYTDLITSKYKTIFATKSDVGAPLVASNTSQMTDHTKIYVYTGSQSGYTSGNWYYWNGSAWASGGVYNSSAVTTDTTLSQSGKAADAKATGDQIDLLKKSTDIFATDASSTATAFKVTIPGVSSYYDGLSFYLYNNTSISSQNNCTLNVNSLGAKPIYNSALKRVTRELFNNCVVFMTYNTTIVSGGCWMMSDEPVVLSGSGLASVTLFNPDEANVSSGTCSIAGGAGATASGNYSIALGTHNPNLPAPVASGIYSISIGTGTQALGGASVAIGQGTVASGSISYALGNRTVAGGNRSFAIGEKTVTSTFGQVAVGKFNSDNSTHAFMIGNGEDEEHRANAFTVDWNGDINASGSVNVGGHIAMGDVIINGAGLNGGVHDYNMATPYNTIERGTIDNESGETASSTTRVRSVSYISLKAGDEIRSLRNNIVVAVGLYSSDNTTSYVGINTLDFGGSYLVKNDQYIKIILRYSDNRTIQNTSAVFNDLLSGVSIVRKYTKAKEFVDGFEYGGLLSNTNEGILNNANDYINHRTARMYDISGSNVVGVTFDDSDFGNISAATANFYSGDFSSVVSITSVLKDGMDNISFAVPNGYKYVMICVDHSITTKDFHNTNIFADRYIEKVYLPDKGADSSYDAIAFNYKVFGDVMTSGRLLLPPNYSISGKKVPLIVWVHGSKTMINWNDTIRPHEINGEPRDYVTLYHYMQNEGFAVFDCYPWTNKVSTDAEMWSPMQMPVNERAYIEGVKYVCEHFNVDIDNVTLLCKSQGGNIGHWAYMQTEFPFRAVGLLAPTCDPVTSAGNMWYGSAMRTFLFNYIDFQGTTAEKNAFKSSGDPTNSNVASFLRKNKGKIVSMIPYAFGITGAVSVDELLDGGVGLMQATPQWMLDEGVPTWQSGYDYIPAFATHSDYSKHAQCPTKFWCAFDDESTSAYGSYAIHRYLENGGSDSEFRVMPLGTGGHASVDSSPLAPKSSGTTALGIAYSDVPTAYVEFIEFASRYIR